MTNDMTKGEAIAARLRLAREQAGLTQGQVAKMLDLHRPSISEVEAGRRKVSAEELSEFARIYGVTVTWLVGEETQTSSVEQDRILLAARELSKMNNDDLDRLVQLLSALRTQGGGK